MRRAAAIDSAAGVAANAAAASRVPGIGASRAAAEGACPGVIISILAAAIATGIANSSSIAASSIPLHPFSPSSSEAVWDP